MRKFWMRTVGLLLALSLLLGGSCGSAFASSESSEAVVAAAYENRDGAAVYECETQTEPAVVEEPEVEPQPEQTFLEKCWGLLVRFFTWIVTTYNAFIEWVLKVFKK